MPPTARWSCAAPGVDPYDRIMSSSADPQHEVVDLNAGVDPQKRAEVRAWAKRVLADSRKRHTPEFFAQLRADLGLPAQPAR
jgi:hypothetical protein